MDERCKMSLSERSVALATEAKALKKSPFVSHLERAGLKGPRMRWWYLYVAALYVVWFALVFGVGYWQEVRAHWPISLVMILGSVVAGSTPMGGGSVAFPVLVLLFGQSPNMGRNFAMTIQALGMTSAMIFIFCRRTPVQVPMLVWTSVGAAFGLVVGTFFVAPLVGASYVKLLFSCLWMSFAVLTLIKNRELCSLQGTPSIALRPAIQTGLVVGFAGGVTASMIGVGVEMMLYTVLVLLYRCDLKAAVPTAVSAMAVGSLVGTGLHALIGDIEREVLYNWLASAPIVVFGAPFGAYLVSVIPRVRTLYFVSFVCVIQFVWTLYQVSPTRQGWLFVVVSISLANAVFCLLYRRGRARMR